jgi:structural maintenance of chromosome 4
LLESTDESIAKVTESIEAGRAEKTAQKAVMVELTENTRALEQEFVQAQQEMRSIKEQENRLNANIDTVQSEITETKKESSGVRKKIDAIMHRFDKLGIPIEQIEQSEEETVQQLDVEKASLENNLTHLNPNLSVIDLFNEKNEIYERNLEDFRVVDREKTETAHHLNDLAHQRFSMFDDGFRTISAKVKETYQILALGGDAELEYVDKADPWNRGICFSVRPPGKSWKNIGNLSGGEKTLSSLALVFALHQFKPTPCYIMDEIDAALDFRICPSSQVVSE